MDKTSIRGKKKYEKHEVINSLYRNKQVLNLLFVGVR